MSELTTALVSGAITILVGGFFVHASARLVLDRSTWIQAIVAFVLGTFAASVALALVQGAIGAAAASVVGLLAMALTFALVYRTKWYKGAIVGVVAWLIWVAVNAAVRYVMARLQG